MVFPCERTALPSAGPVKNSWFRTAKLGMVLVSCVPATCAASCTNLAPLSFLSLGRHSVVQLTLGADGPPIPATPTAQMPPPRRDSKTRANWTTPEGWKAWLERARSEPKPDLWNTQDRRLSHSSSHARLKDMPVGDMNLEDLIDMFPNIEPFLIRKWHYAFYTFFDLTGNNVIEWRDFQTLIDAIGAVRGEDGEEHTAARHSLTDVWHSMTETMKKDVNDKITLVDWIGMWAESHTGGKEPAWQKAYLDYMFRLFDASGDELVDLSEYVEVLGYFSIPREDAITCFDRFAVSPAGAQFNSIDYGRFMNLWHQYFRSTDINDVGNHLLGTV